MKLAEHVEKLRTLITVTFEKEFSRLGIGATKSIELDKLPQELQVKRQRLAEILKSHAEETGGDASAREKTVDELTFTLFNRIAAVKVMEASSLFPPIFTKQAEHGDRSFGHKAWLEVRPDMRSEELEGIREYLKHAFNALGETLPLYNRDYPYALLPDAISLNEIIDAFNAVEKDPQVEDEIWQSDDVLGWLYESYNNTRKKEFKESKEKVEFNKVSLQSQVYTPRWVVQFLIENSLGKLYLEMYPDSEIKNQFKIANAPKTQERAPKPLNEIKLIDPACGSGNFLLYAFDFYYALYVDQIENFGADYEENEIPKLIIENNLHGIDLDDRAVQLAQLGLYIKARKKQRSIGSLNFKVVSSDFYLPDYEVVQEIFEPRINTNGHELSEEQIELIQDIWDDLKLAFKFGSLIRISERISNKLKDAHQRAENGDLFAWGETQAHENFSAIFFENLKIAIEQHARMKGNTFLTSKTRDAITFLELLTTEYDVATANPPYTDSADFGPELKKFIEDNYKKPYKFHTNLYATFIKRCYDFVGDRGFVAMVHPPTFMYIKTFEDVRKFIIDKTHINFFVEWGYLGMFNPSARVDSSLYIIKKEENPNKDSIFIKLNHLYETKRYDALFEAYEKFLEGESHEILYSISQSKLKIIKSWPFIYWISDEFREKFGTTTLEKKFNSAIGLQTSNNERFVRLWWEIYYKKNLEDVPTNVKWISYDKGGPFNKWFGNNWAIVNWQNDGNEIKNFKDATGKQKSVVRNEKYYFKKGVTFPLSGTKGASFRLFEDIGIFDISAPCIFAKNSSSKILILLGILNSKLVKYILDCLNPTVHVTTGDINRVPIASISEEVQAIFFPLVSTNINIKKHLNSFTIYEKEFKKSPLDYFSDSGYLKNISNYFNYENYLLTQILINETVIDEKIFDVYDLTEHDKAIVLAKEGNSIGGLPVLVEAREAYLAESEATIEFPLDEIRSYIKNLPLRGFTNEERKTIESGFPSLYQSNNDLEEFCIHHQVNPINVWYWFKQGNVIPQQRMHTLAMEFLADMIREILMKDEDGIIPLVSNAGEKVLIDRIEEKFHEKGFSSAQFSSFDSVLGRPISDHLNKHFFAELSDHLNLFMYLPKTPFIWHLSSGSEQGFGCYIIIYKWSRDKLMHLKSVYIEHRERALINRQSDLADNDSAEAQNKKDKIFKQLKEIEVFKQKIDELLTEGYNPILDDGVGKNIAPLQQKKMIPYEVLNAGQLKKYLNADW